MSQDKQIKVLTGKEIDELVESQKAGFVYGFYAGCLFTLLVVIIGFP